MAYSFSDFQHDCGLMITWPVRAALNVAADLVSEVQEPREFNPCTFAMNAPGPRSQKEPLGPAQLVWCDTNFGKFQGFGIMRRQAEAARGKSVA